MSAQQLFAFPGGLALAGRKVKSDGPLRQAPLTDELVIPLQQHQGTAAEALAPVGATVARGELLAREDAPLGASIHAPTSGVVAAIEPRPVPHPSGLPAPCIVLRPDGEDRWTEHGLPPLDDWARLEPALLRQRVRDAGIVGLGGAGFPAAAKLETAGAPPVRLLIVNGVECEPYISCDQALMEQRADAVVTGACMLAHAVQAERTVIALEDDKPEAAAALRQALEQRPEPRPALTLVPARYPAGGERQLIRTLTGHEVPTGAHPTDIGMLCQNVGTAAAVYRAVAFGEPLTSRIVTVAGEALQSPCNVEARIGTPLSALVAMAGGYCADDCHLILGGPMMGYTLPDDSLPVTKTSNCVLALPAMSRPSGGSMPCIRCGFCAETCPVSLLPQQLYWHSRARDFEQAETHGLFDCIECGACAPVCPSHIPLVDYFRYAKSELRREQRERRQAELARERYELRQQRLARQQQEREQRRERKKAALHKPARGEDAAAAKQTAIQEAIRRARQKKQARTGSSGGGDDTSRQA